MMDDLYSELIIDHYKNPRNFGELEDFTLKGRGANASCGDMVELYVKLDGETIIDISFKGIGCALSTASASMLTEKIKHEHPTAIELGSMTNEKIVAMMGIEVSPTRMKCVSLPLRALIETLKDTDAGPDN